MWFLNSYSADSQHWVDPDTSRGIWRHTQSSACLAGRYPKAAPHIHSNTLGWWPSRPQSCVEWWRRWGRSEPAGSFCKRDFSADDTQETAQFDTNEWRLGESAMRWENPPAPHCQEWWRPWQRWFQPYGSSAPETGNKGANIQMFECELQEGLQINLDFCKRQTYSPLPDEAR